MPGGGRQFQPGKSGNPSGRPPGQLTERRELRGVVGRLNTEHDIMGKFALAAAEGDSTAAKWFCDRLVPPLKSQSAPVDILNGKRLRSLKEAAESLLDAMMNGRLSPSTFAEVVVSLESYSKVVEISALMEEIAELRKLVRSQQLD